MRMTLLIFVSMSAINLGVKSQLPLAVFSVSVNTLGYFCSKEAHDDLKKIPV